MRILVVGNSFSGITSSLVMALKKNSSSDVIHASPTLKLLKFRWLFITLMALEGILYYGSKFRKYLTRTWFGYYAKSLTCDELLKKYNPDAIILIGANHLNFWAKKQNTIFNIFTDHTNLLSKKLPDYGFDIPERRVSNRWNKIEKHILGLQNNVFVLSKHVRNSMIFDYGINPDIVKVVGAGPNLDVDIDRDGIKKNFSGQNILFVGLDAQRKGLSDLISAFNQVLRYHPKSKLHIVGSNGKSDYSIIYHGELYGKKLKDLFYESQIFCLPTYREPFGIVFLEAMYSKCVCIGTNIEAIPEIIDHRKTGYLCKPGDTDAIVKYINCLLSNTDNLRVMAELGYQKIKSTWSWDNTAKKVLEVLGSYKPYSPPWD